MVAEAAVVAVGTRGGDNHLVVGVGMPGEAEEDAAAEGTVGIVVVVGDIAAAAVGDTLVGVRAAVAASVAVATGAGAGTAAGMARHIFDLLGTAAVVAVAVDAQVVLELAVHALKAEVLRSWDRGRNTVEEDEMGGVGRRGSP